MGAGPLVSQRSSYIIIRKRGILQEFDMPSKNVKMTYPYDQIFFKERERDGSWSSYFWKHLRAFEVPKKKKHAYTSKNNWTLETVLKLTRNLHFSNTVSFVNFHLSPSNVYILLPLALLLYCYNSPSPSLTFSFLSFHSFAVLLYTSLHVFSSTASLT